MKLTLLQVGEIPAPLRDRFSRFDSFFERLFSEIDGTLAFESVPIHDGAPFPDPKTIEAVVIPGSAYGVYDTPDWMDPLRDFIRAAYGARTPMLGVCFGHQIMADALGGEVRKSDKGWGIGRHTYSVVRKHPVLDGLGGEIAIAASHQDQVVVPPPGTEVFLFSPFTPYAGLAYDNGAAISVQPHPEFDVEFSRALVELQRQDPLSDDFIDERLASLDAALDNGQLAEVLLRFLKEAARR